MRSPVRPSWRPILTFSTRRWTPGASLRSQIESCSVFVIDMFRELTSGLDELWRLTRVHFLVLVVRGPCDVAEAAATAALGAAKAIRTSPARVPRSVLRVVTDPPT